MKTSSTSFLVAAICIAEILSMLAFGAYPSFIPVLQKQWVASNSEIGWVAGIYLGGYAVAVTVLVSLTDQVDARRIYLLSMALTAIATLGFGLATNGVAAAAFWRCLQGIGLAGTYMPGLKALVDNVPKEYESRTVAIYTSSFVFGVGVSFFAAGFLGSFLSWPIVFVILTAGPVLAIFIAAVFLPSAKVHKRKALRLLPDFRPVLKNRTTVGFSLVYCVHSAEYFVFTSWAVAFLHFAFSRHESMELWAWATPATIVALASLISPPFSVLTNEIAQRTNRSLVVIVVMLASAVTGVVLGISSVMPVMCAVVLVFLYASMTHADSGSITAAVVQSSKEEYLGSTMAFHSLLGYGGGFIGPVVFGLALDLAGGETSPVAWVVSFVVVAVIILGGPIAILKLAKQQGA